MHTPLSQYGVVGSHFFPQAPQLLMSLFRFVHASPQQVKSQKPHAPPPEPPMPLELLAAPPAPPLPPVPIEPPSPPVPAVPDELEED